MSYKNSVKLLTSNFSLVWKQLLYMLLTIILVLGISFWFFKPIFDLLKTEGVIEEINTIFEKIYTSPKEVTSSIASASDDLIAVLNANISSLWPYFLGIGIFGVFLYQVLKNISIYNLASLMHSKMTSFASLGYSSNLVSNFVVSLRFSLAKIVMKLPFATLKFLIIYTFFMVVKTPLSVLVGIFIVCLLIIVLSAIELSLFSGMAACLIDRSTKSAFKAFFKGAIPVFKTFPRVLSNSLIVVLTLVLVNVFLGIFTIGVGLLITLPASMVFVVIFQLAAYFGAVKGRYYLSAAVIVTPLGEEKKEF